MQKDDWNRKFQVVKMKGLLVLVVLVVMAKTHGEMYFCKKGERKASEATSDPVKIRTKIQCAVMCSSLSTDCSSFNWQPVIGEDFGGHCLVFGSFSSDSDIATDSSANYCERYEVPVPEKQTGPLQPLLETTLIEAVPSESTPTVTTTPATTAKVTVPSTNPTTTAVSRPVFVTITNMDYSTSSSKCVKSTMDSCRTYSCAFATIKDADKQALVEKRLGGCTTSDCKRLWISLKKAKGTTTWVWEDGQVITANSYTNWAAPDDGLSLISDLCVYIDRVFNYQWMTGSCTQTFTTLCDIIYPA